MVIKSRDELSEEEITKYGGRGSCENWSGCNLFCASDICHLYFGHNHPDCPARIETRILHQERIKNNPEMQKLIAKHRKLVAKCSGNKQK